MMPITVQTKGKLMFKLEILSGVLVKGMSADTLWESPGVPQQL